MEFLIFFIQEYRTKANFNMCEAKTREIQKYGKKNFKLRNDVRKPRKIY